MKDDLFYIQPIVKYATLSDYNHVSKMDFPKRKQPSCMFPTLPDVSPVVPLDTLTHHTDRNYPTVNHAYGPFHRPKYYVGKCPSNKFVRNFDTPPPTTTPSPTIESYSAPPIQFGTKYTYQIEYNGYLISNAESGVGNNTFTTATGSPTTLLSYNGYVIKPYFKSLPTSCPTESSTHSPGTFPPSSYSTKQVYIKYAKARRNNKWTEFAFSNNTTTSLTLGNKTIIVTTGQINCIQNNNKGDGFITVPMTFYQS